YRPTGDWIAKYTDARSTYITEFDTRVIPFYYAGRPLSNDHWVDTATGKLSDFSMPGFVVLSPSIPYVYEGTPFNKSAFLQKHDLIYSNGEVTVSLIPIP